MDPTEDVSARILLKNILSIESPRTPITSSVSQGASGSGTRRSDRLSKKNAGPQTPQDILRRSLKHKMRESITRKSLPATRRRTASVVLRKINTPAASMLFDDADTPRHILMNILQTEPVHSPVVHETGASEEPEPPTATSSVHRTRSSIELSGLDLPDITIGNIPSTAKGLSRKRQRRSLNVTAFEKRLKDGDDTGEVTEESIDNHSSLSLSSSSSLSLKTPFVYGQTEKRGLQRRVSNRRKITEEEFGAAVNKLQMGGESSAALVQRDLCDTAHSEGFTLGLSKLSEPDITTDIVNCNTALYDQPDAMTSDFSIVATQDKPTVMASQLQRQMEQEEQMEVEQSDEGKTIYVFPYEEGAVVELQSDNHASESQEDVDGAESQEEERRRTTHGQPQDVAVSSEEGDVAESQTDSQPEDHVEASSHSEEAEVVPDSQTEEKEEEEEEAAAESQTEEESADEAGSQPEVDEDAPDSDTEKQEGEEDDEEEEEDAAESQTKEESAVDSQPEEDVEAGSQSAVDEDAPDSDTEKQGEEEDEEEEEEDAAESQTEEGESLSQFEGDVEVESHSVRDEAESQNKHDCDGKQEEEEQTSEQLKGDFEHISRRAYRSDGALIIPVRKAGEDLTNNTVAGWSDAKSKAHSGLETRGYECSEPHVGEPDLAESSTQGQTDAFCPESEADADKENSFHLPEVAQDTEDSGHPRDAFADQSPAQDASEQEEELDDEEDGEEGEEFPCKTPAFVREKRNFLHPEHLSSPSVSKNIQARSTSEALTPAKPKQVRQRKKGPAKKAAGLPKSYLMGVFKHFAKTKVSADVYPVLNETMDKFFDRMVEDLETFAAHAKRKTIEVEDCVLLLKRQGYVNDKVPVEVLIEKYLSMQQRKLLIPIATSGNVVFPKMRK
ncbi:centromere protein T [Stegastes partitus]|uniref:Centromere protein T n=1 Tax=Stegastes partitus TaxID=144197 RepID=A0A3B5B0E3_9TELE|nr:PREDICTED: centromere protein T [Stegastes partitus]